MAKVKKEIGPSFADELAAYKAESGVKIIGEHFSWNKDGTLEFFDDTPDEVVAAVRAVYKAHDPGASPPVQ